MRRMLKPKHILIQNQLDLMRKQVGFDSYDLAVRQLLDMFESGDIFVPEDYQRQFVWDEQRESMLIESAYLGIPIPSLFMATNPDSTWEIVDGVQRLCTFAHYCGGDILLKLINKKDSLVINDLQKLASLNGTIFESIQKSVQLRLLNCPIRVTVLNDKSDLEVRFDLFERLNTGGVQLTQQEIRNCVFRGSLVNDIKSLANNKNFLKCIHLKPVDKNNGTKEEFVLRYFAYLNKYKTFDHSVKDFLNDYMKDNYKKSIKSVEIKRFEDTFAFLASELPKGIIRGNRKITPVNLFEAISVGTSLALSKKKASINKKVLNKFINDAELRKFTTGATNTTKMVRSRIEYVYNKLIE